MSESKELAFLPTEETAMTVFTTGEAIDPYLAQIRAEIDLFVPDISTKKGRDAIASMAYKVSQSKSALEALGKAQADKAKEMPNLIDATRKHVKDTLDKWRNEVRKPLDDWEAEQAEIEAKRIADEAEAERVRLAEIAARELQEQIDRDHELAVFMYAEHLRQKEEAAKQAIIDAELAAQAQKEREERIAREAAENARIAAEQAAEAERRRLQNEADRQAKEAQLAIERANREKVEQEVTALRREQEHAQALAKAEQDRLAAIEAEQKRQRDEQARIAVEEETRARNKAHAKKINNEILADMVSAGCSEDCAKAIIAAIVKGNIRHTNIKY